MSKKCTICDDKHFARGYCVKHYTQHRRHGNAQASKPKRTKTLQLRVTPDEHQQIVDAGAECGGYSQFLIQAAMEKIERDG